MRRVRAAPCMPSSPDPLPPQIPLPTSSLSAGAAMVTNARGPMCNVIEKVKLDDAPTWGNL